MSETDLHKKSNIVPYDCNISVWNMSSAINQLGDLMINWSAKFGVDLMKGLHWGAQKPKGGGGGGGGGGIIDQMDRQKLCPPTAPLVYIDIPDSKNPQIKSVICHYDRCLVYRNWYQYWDHYGPINNLGLISPQHEGEVQGLWWAS